MRKYTINVSQRDWTIILDRLDLSTAPFDPLKIGKDSDIGKFAHIRADKDDVILFVHDVIWVSVTNIKDKRFNETVKLTHNKKVYEGTLNDALELIKKELEDE